MIVRSKQGLQLYALGGLAWLGFMAFILAGGFFIAGKGSAMLPLAAPMIGKTLLDLALHQRSNR